VRVLGLVALVGQVDRLDVVPTAARDHRRGRHRDDRFAQKILRAHDRGSLREPFATSLLRIRQRKTRPGAYVPDRASPAGVLEGSGALPSNGAQSPGLNM